jgi:hypothetical protein
MLPSKTIRSMLCSDEFIFGSLILNPCRRHKAALNPIISDSDEPSPHVPAGPKKDYSLKEGQTFSISIPGRAKATTANSLLGSTSSHSAATSTSSTVPLLPPPPSSTKRHWRLCNFLVVSPALNITRSLLSGKYLRWLAVETLTIDGLFSWASFLKINYRMVVRDLFLQDLTSTSRSFRSCSVIFGIRNTNSHIALRYDDARGSS